MRKPSRALGAARCVLMGHGSRGAVGGEGGRERGRGRGRGREHEHAHAHKREIAQTHETTITCYPAHLFRLDPATPTPIRMLMLMPMLIPVPMPLPMPMPMLELKA